MKTTMNMNEVSKNPIANLMKPITLYTSENRAQVKAAQEAAVMEFMRQQVESVKASRVFIDIPSIPEVKGLSENMRDRWGMTAGVRRTSSILRRLEQKGELVSVLFGGARYYSIPQGGRF